ncbi:pyruvate dehydrogenase complex dihydrolipoamide acetyltransferase [soil metagenome]
MAVEVKLPRLGQGMEAGSIVRWLKSEGDPVAKGEPLYELDTDKVTQEVEAEAEGVLLKILVPEGEADVGATVGVIGAEGEEVAAAEPSGEEPEPPSAEAPAEPAAAKKAEPGPEKAKAEQAEAEGAEKPTAEPSDESSQGDGAGARAAAPPSPPADARTTQVKASPLARRIARERGVELHGLSGTGPDGRIVAEDVEQAAVAREASAAGPAEAPEIEVVPLTSIRKTIARRLTQAWEAPVFQLTVTADASELALTRERMVELLREGDVKPTVNDILTRLTAAALMRHRAVNAQFVEGEIHRYATANVGIAVATPNGLVVPVIREADRKSVAEIAGARADLVSRARTGKLQLQDLEGGTFTISNLGMYGVEQFIAVLNPPQVAILAVGSIEDRPLVVEGELLVVPTLTMTLTCDHRAIDGSEGAEFLRTLKAFVETPSLAL